jgi:hypothetical protein
MSLRLREKNVALVDGSGIYGYERKVIVITV